MRIRFAAALVLLTVLGASAGRAQDDPPPVPTPEEPVPEEPVAEEPVPEEPSPDEPPPAGGGTTDPTTGETVPGPAGEQPSQEETTERLAALTQDAIAARELVAPSLVAGDAAFGAQDWDAAIEAYLRAVEVLETVPVLGGVRDSALYNAACSFALRDAAGDRDRAADAFARCLEHGMRAMVEPAGEGRWRLRPGLSIEHILADTDLAGIRDHPVYVAAMRPILHSGELVLGVVGRPPAAGGDADPGTAGESGTPVPPGTADGASAQPLPTVLVLAATHVGARAMAQQFAAVAAPRPYMLAVLDGPIRRAPGRLEWVLSDGDERWGVQGLERALEQLRSDPRVDAAHLYVVAADGRAGEIAWSVVLAQAERLAGAALLGARFHRHFHADGIAAVPQRRADLPPWTIVLGEGDADASRLLRSADVEPRVIETGLEPQTLIERVLVELLGP